MENLVSYLTVLPSSREEINDFAIRVIDEIINNENPLKIAVQLKCIEELLKTIKENSNYKENLIEEVKKYHKNENCSYDENNLNITERPTYDFTVCEDSFWNSKNEKVKEIKDEIKDRESFLKAIKPDQEVYDENGLQLFGPAKVSKTTVSITLKK